MKHLLLGIAIASTFGASAQTQLVGITGGVTRTNVTGSFSGREPQAKTGFSAGFSYQYRTKGHLQFGADLLYQQRGYYSELIFSVPQNPGYVITPCRLNYNYLALPLKVGLRYGKTFYGFGNIGLMPGLRINTNLSWEEQRYSGGVFEGSSVNNVNGRVFDLAGLAEIGAGYALNKRFHVSATVGIQYSLTTYDLPSYFSASSRHYGANGSVGLQYALRR